MIEQLLAVLAAGVIVIAAALVYALWRLDRELKGAAGLLRDVAKTQASLMKLEKRVAELEARRQ